MSYGRSEGGLSLKIDLDQLVWLHLQKCATAFDAPEYASTEQHTKFGGAARSSGKVTLERFENAVLALYDLILPEWIDEDNKHWPEREAAYWGAKAMYLKQFSAWEEAVRTWDKDPMHHPSRPLEPLEPKPFQAMFDEAYDKATGEWQPFKLHKAIIQLLHRKGFFKDKTQVETIEGVSELITPEDHLESSQNTAATAGANDKSTLPLSPDS